MGARKRRAGLNPPELPFESDKAASFAAYFCAANTFLALQHEPSVSCKINSAYKRMSWSGGTWPPATFLTCKFCNQSSVTPSRGNNARLASSDTSVVGLSIPAIFISAAADLTAFSPPETLGIYRRCESATVFSSGFEARYPFSTDNFAALTGFVSTHFAPFNKARVPAAAALGFARRNFPFTITAQQYYSLYGMSAA